MLELIKDLWGFMRVRKKLWMLPILVTLVLLGGLVVLGSNPTVAPFIYTLF